MKPRFSPWCGRAAPLVASLLQRLKTLAVEAAPGLLAFTLYLRTLAPGVYGYDSAELATGAYTLGIVHPTGYPLFLLIARGFMFLPVRSPAYRANLVSAVFGALTVWIVYRIVRNLTGRRWIGWISAGALATSWSFWGMATVAEVYTLNTFFLALCLLLGERLLSTQDERWLCGIAFVFGLGLTNHVTSLMFAPALLFIAICAVPARRLFRMAPKLALLGCLGLLPYAYLPIRYAANPSLDYVRTYYGVDLRTPGGLLWMVSGQAYRFFAFEYDIPGYVRELASFTRLLWRNMAGLGVLIGIVGIVGLLRRRNTVGLGALFVFAPTVLFFAGYGVADKSTMFLPAYVAWAIFLALGIDLVHGWVKWIGAQLTTPKNLFPAAVSAVLALMIVVTAFANWPWVDLSSDNDPEILGQQVMNTVPANALVVGPWSPSVVLEYYQRVEGDRLDIVIFNQSRYEVAEYYKLWSNGVDHASAVRIIKNREATVLREASASRPVYDIEYDPQLALNFEYKPIGNLFRLVPFAPP